jgi:aryl-phospho-beta-D-glucosidase BglC (GH1 family)
MAIYDENDPRLEGYKPVEDFRKKDHDRSSRRIRDMPYGRRKQDGNLSPAELNFGIIGINDISLGQKAILHNDGYDDLPINAMSIVGDFVVTTDCGASLKPGEMCQINIQFNPKREGILTGGLYVDTGDAAGTEFVKLRGTGELSEVIDPVDPDPTVTSTMTPAALSFGSIEVDTVSFVSVVTLTNTGTSAMVISNIAVPAQFTQTNDCGSGLATGESCDISVRFAPTSVGARAGNLSVSHNGTGTKTVTLAGLGIAETDLPVISISDSVLEERSGTPAFNVPSASVFLGSEAFGETAESVFYLTATSAGDVELITMPAAGSGFTFGYALTSAGPFLPQAGFTIPASGRMYVRARASGVPGDYARTVTFASALETKTVSLTATIEEEAVPVSMPRIRVAGNQFYKAVDEFDLGGTLPVTGGTRLASVNWFGAEGTNNTPHGTWLVPWKGILDQIKGMGFNCIRLPFSGDTADNPLVPDTAIDEEINADLVGKYALEIFDMIISYCEEIDLYVVLDHHRRSAGNGADGEPTDGSYSQSDWLASWGVMANRYKDAVNVVGADVHNEPHNLTWDAWATAAEACGDHILTIAPDWIIFVEGVGNIGDDHYWWGGQLMGVRERPVVLSAANRLCYSPHEYGQSVGSQSWQKKDGNNPDGWPLNQAAVWDKFWGFIFYENIAPIWIGEMGGHFGLDGDGNLTNPHRVEESEWMSHLVRYLDWDQNINGSVAPGEAVLANGGKRGMSFAWWSFNPNSGDTGGLVQDDWVTPQNPKLALLTPILNDETIVVPLDLTPADILNIGTGSGQNHFGLQYGKTGDSLMTFIDVDAVAAGHVFDPNFKLTPDETAVHFQVRMDAPKTEGSLYPRSELREVTSAGANMAFDALSGTHILRGKSKITHLPSMKPEVVVAQLHNGTTDRVAIGTQFSLSGNTVLLCRINGISDENQRYDLDYQVGTEFEWMIKVVDGTVSVYFDDMTTPLFTSTDLTTTGSSSWYFKAGAHSQSNDTIDDATEYVSVELRNLFCSHT